MILWRLLAFALFSASKDDIKAHTDEILSVDFGHFQNDVEESLGTMRFYRNHREALQRFCSERKRFEFKSPGKAHHIQMEHIIKVGEHAIVCLARSTKMLKPKGDPYAVKLSFSNVKEEAAILAEMQSISSVIKCRFECKIAYVRVKTKSRNTMKMFTYQALPLQYFPSFSLREWLRRLAAPVFPKDPATNRMRLLHLYDVKRAYARSKQSLMEMWHAGWVHGDVHVGNILYSPGMSEAKLVDVGNAKSWARAQELFKNWDTQQAVEVPFLEWMDFVATDFQYFVFTFGLTIICPEEFTPTDPPLRSDQRHPDAEDCISYDEIEQIMREYDKDYAAMTAYFVTPAAEKKILSLPDEFRNIARSLAGWKEKSPSEYSDSPPTYAEVTSDSWGIPPVTLDEIATVARADANPTAQEPSNVEAMGFSSLSPPISDLEKREPIEPLPKSIGKQKQNVDSRFISDTEGQSTISLARADTIASQSAAAGSSSAHADIPDPHAPASSSSSTDADQDPSSSTDATSSTASKQIPSTQSSQAGSFNRGNLRQIRQPPSPNVNPLHIPSPNQPPDQIAGVPRVQQMINYFEEISRNTPQRRHQPIISTHTSGASSDSSDMNEAERIGPSSRYMRPDPESSDSPGLTYVVSSKQSWDYKYRFSELTIICFFIIVAYFVYQPQHQVSYRSALLQEEEI